MRIYRHRRHDERTGDGNRRQTQHRQTRTEALDDERANDGSGHTSDVPPTQGIARSRLSEARARQRGDEQENSHVVHEQAEEERSEKTQRVTPEVRNEQIAHGRFGFLDMHTTGLDKGRIGRYIVPDLSEDGDQLPPSLAAARQKPGRFRQNSEQQHRKYDRDDAAQYEQHPPSIGRKNARREKRGERAAQRDAYDGQRDGEWPLPPRHIFRCQCSGVRHGSAESKPGEETKHTQQHQAVDRGNRKREDGK